MVSYSLSTSFQCCYYQLYYYRAAGEGGPDFFIDTYVREATWWNTDHTVWGEIADEESLKIVMGMYELPSTKRGLTFLDKPVHIDIISS